MKLRQKLAMALAAAMVVTSVPVTTMARSTNTINKEMPTLIKDEAITTSEALELTIKLENDAIPTNQDQREFYINAIDFEFAKINEDGEKVTLTAEDFIGDVDDDGDYKGLNVNGVSTATTRLEVGGLELEVLSRTQLRLTMNDDFEEGDVFGIPVIGIVTGEAPVIAVDGAGTVISDSEIGLAEETVSEYTLRASLGTPSHISTEGVGELGEITIEEVRAGELDEKIVKIEMNHTADLHFDYKVGDAVEFEGVRGFANLEDSDAAWVEVIDVDGEDMTIQFKNFDGYARGAVILTGLKTESEDRYEVPEGEVEVTITSEAKYDESDDVANDKTYMAEVEGVIAHVYDYAINLHVEELVDFVAGGEAQEVVLDVSELVVDSLEERSVIYFSVEDAKFITTEDIKLRQKKGSTYITLTDEETFFTEAGELVLDLRDTYFDEEEINEYELTFVVAVHPEVEGDIVVKAETKGYDEAFEIVVGTSTTDKTITQENTAVEVGFRGQVGGSITIQEKEDEALHDDDILFIQLEGDSRRDFLHIEDFDVEVTEGSGFEYKKHTTVYYTTAGGLTISEPNLPLYAYAVYDNVVALEVIRESDEAAEIKITNIKVDTSHATPEGDYDLVLSGTAISEHGKSITREGFITVGEPDLFETTEVVVTVDSKEYTVDGETKTAIAAPYIANDRTMIPLRFVSEEFGADVDFGTINGVGTVTITKDGKVIQFQNESNIMNQNGILIPMDTKTTITNGTTFIPFRYLANALEVDFAWDATAKTVTFTQTQLAQ